jgi:SAM-dependent methyltransferase
MTFSSKSFWENRYRNNGNSGLGSYGDESKFKSSYINDLIKKESIKTITDLGCGDGNQISLLSGFKKYYGYDFSDTALIKAKNINKGAEYEFINNISDLPISDMSMSLDVTYHIIEDNLFDEYLSKLFMLGERYVLIYSMDVDGPQISEHIKSRSFTKWVKENDIKYTLVDVTQYPKKLKANGVGFYLFEKTFK